MNTSTNISLRAVVWGTHHLETEARRAPVTGQPGLHSKTVRLSQNKHRERNLPLQGEGRQQAVSEDVGSCTVPRMLNSITTLGRSWHFPKKLNISSPCDAAILLEASMK